MYIYKPEIAVALFVDPSQVLLLRKLMKLIYANDHVYGDEYIQCCKALLVPFYQ